jgi:hypothetical protein
VYGRVPLRILPVHVDQTHRLTPDDPPIRLPAHGRATRRPVATVASAAAAAAGRAIDFMRVPHEKEEHAAGGEVPKKRRVEG